MADNNPNQAEVSIFQEFIEEVDYRYLEILGGSANDGEVQKKLTWLVKNANHLLEAQGFMNSGVVLDREELKNCRLADLIDEEIVFEPVLLDDDETELYASYSGLAAKEEIDEAPGLVVQQLKIVHKLLVEAGRVESPFYREKYERYAVMPLVDYEQIQFI